MQSRLATIVFCLGCATLGIVATDAARADQLPLQPCIPGAAGPPVGIVTAISGRAWAEAEICDAPMGRALGCGESIYAGEHIVTDPGAAVAFTIGQSEVYVAPSAELGVALRSNGEADLMLLRGRARVVDPDGATGAGRRLASGDLVSVGRGDSEISVIAGQPAVLCEYALPLAVGDASLAPGNCTGPGFASRPADHLGVSLADAERCDVATSGDFDPFEVAGGPGLSPFPPSSAPRPPLPSCAFGSCSGAPVVVVSPTKVLIESPAINEPPPP